jgi:hypothetical protein
VHWFNIAGHDPSPPPLPRVISGPFTLSLDNIHKSPCPPSLSLLTRMKRIVPKIRVWTSFRNTVCSARGAVMNISCNVCWSRAVEVLRGIVVLIQDLGAVLEA